MFIFRVKKRSTTTLLHALEKRRGEGEKNFFFSGPPGVGKSSILLHIVLLWSEYLQNEREDIKRTCLADIEQVIFIKPEHCQDSLRESVKTVLQKSCGTANIGKHMKFFNMHKDKTVLVIESLDEISHLPKLITEIEQEMRNQSRIIIVAARAMHPVTKMFSDITSVKRLRVVGFSESKIGEFIDNFFSDDPETGRHLHKQISVDDEFRSLLSIPLILILVCFLLLDGSLDIDTLTKMSMFQIFDEVEKLLTEREHIDPQCLDKFHQLAFTHLLDEKIIYKKDVLEINPDLLKLSYISVEKSQHIREARKGQVVKWLHKTFCEFGAAKYLSECKPAVQDRLLTLIASQRRMSYALGFALGLLSPATDVYQGLLNTILATQNELEIECEDLKEDCHSPRNTRISRTIEDITASDVVEEHQCSIVDFSYDNIYPCARCIIKANSLATESGLAVLGNCFDVLNILPEETKKIVFDNTITSLLPASRYVVGLVSTVHIRLRAWHI